MVCSRAKRRVVIVVGIAAAFVSTRAFAQEPAAAPAAPATVHDETPDHDKFVGHFAVGYMGVNALPIGGGTPQNPTLATLNAPVIGVRYWLQQMVGLDLGLGFASSSGSTETSNGMMSTTADNPSNLGFALHAGVPLALARAHHLTFEVVPEANVGFTSGTIKSAAVMNPPPDISLSGFRLDVGGRVGAEIHFGFIGIPQLSLEGSVGLYVRRNAAKVKQDVNSGSIGTWNIGTTVGSDPWALFTNNISALYYF